MLVKVPVKSQSMSSCFTGNGILETEILEIDCIRWPGLQKHAKAIHYCSIVNLSTLPIGQSMLWTMFRTPDSWDATEPKESLAMIENKETCLTLKIPIMLSFWPVRMPDGLRQCSILGAEFRGDSDWSCGRMQPWNSTQVRALWRHPTVRRRWWKERTMGKTVFQCFVVFGSIPFNSWVLNYILNILYTHNSWTFA